MSASIPSYEQQNFVCAHMPLMAATSIWIRHGEEARLLLDGVTCTVSIPSFITPSHNKLLTTKCHRQLLCKYSKSESVNVLIIAKITRATVNPY